LIQVGELQEAENQTKQRIVADPDDPTLRILLGRIYLAGENGAAASSSFKRARELGASDQDLRAWLVQALILQGRHEEVLSLLPTSMDRADVEESLVRRRVHALLRISFARPRDIFYDAQHLLLLEGGNAASDLESLARDDDVIAENAEHVRRAIAYWHCQQPFAAEGSPRPSLYEPAWAVVDSSRRILRVGPEHDLKVPSAAAGVAQDGDIIEIQAGTYEKDVAVWNASDLWIRAVDGKVVLESHGTTAENMGIWVIRGRSTVIDGIRFAGARSTDKNGSGIRMLGHNLWIRASEFHDNETGLLGGREPGGEVVVERSVFTDNGAGDGQSHNVYIGRTGRLIFRFNYSTGVKIGHQLKSRALENYILYNRLADESDGNSSYTINLPEGGFALVMGNELQQGPLTVNRHMISLGEEDSTGREHRFIFAYNTFYNNTFPATLIRDATGAGAVLINNLFAGAPTELDTTTTQWIGNGFGTVADASQGDYRLSASTSLIDSGEPILAHEDVPIVPEFEYVHPAGAVPRRVIWRPDPGAHEFCGWPQYP